MFSYKDSLVALIQHFQGFHDNAVRLALRIVALFLYGDAAMDRVVEKDRPDKAQTIVSVAHRTRVDGGRRHTDAYAEDERSVSHSLTERLRATPFRVHVVRVKIARLARVHDDIGFGNRTADGLMRCACFVVFKKHFVLQVCSHPFCESEFHVDFDARTYHPIERMSTVKHNVELSGMTWNHTRGYLPVVATAQRFGELHPEVSIAWQKRSLQKFADAPLDELAKRFDLLVIDHPSIGEAASENLLLPLDEYLPVEFLADQAANSVGQSHASYFYEGHQYALAIDAATPIAGWRPDLMERAEVQPPLTWEELLALARRGLVTVPAIPIDSLMHLFMFGNALGAEPFSLPDEVLPASAGSEALQLLRELVSLSAEGSLQRNPIQTWQLLSESDNVAYCPFAYGYSNYSRPGYGCHIVQVGELVSFAGQPLRSTLGGAGLAISKSTPHAREALAYAEFTASGVVQRTLYTSSGGQPGHRGAWLDDATNELSQNFFRSTLATLDAAWVRPRFPGFIAFQDRASTIVHRYLSSGGRESSVLEQMNAALREHMPASGVTA
jgi:multiple sugar transport system substrate-binding protein